ncbi:MAG: 2Fe-2S iron-sulfur cluster-binding protein [Myxococcota bacterium]
MPLDAASAPEAELDHHEVRFLPSGRSIRVRPGTTLLSAAMDGQLPLASSCDGTGICKACVVRVVEGTMNLSPVAPMEREAQLDIDQRLACLARVAGPVSITTTYW